MKNYPEITQSISKNLKKFSSSRSSVLQAFQQLAKASTQDEALSEKTKEFIALALGIAAHCDGCIGFHVKKPVQLGASDEEILEAMGMAVYMGGGPSLMYAAEAMDALEQFRNK